MHAPLNEDTKNARRLAALIRDVVRVESFDSLADLADVIKHRCARLRLPITADSLNAAITMLTAAGVQLVPEPAAVAAPVDRLASAPPIFTREEASAITDQLLKRFGVRIHG